MTAPAELIESAKCVDCNIADGSKLSVLIYLFAQIAGVPADPTTLMDNARCIDNCVPPGMRLSVLIALADTIANLPAPVSDAVTCGTGAPTTAPSTGCGVYYDTNNDAVYIYRGGAWVLKV